MSNMTWDEAHRLYNRGERVPSCFLSKDGKLRSRHSCNGFMSPPIRQDTPYYYPEIKTTVAPPEPSPVNAFQELSARFNHLQNQYNAHIDASKKKEFGVVKL